MADNNQGDNDSSLKASSSSFHQVIPVGNNTHNHRNDEGVARSDRAGRPYETQKAVHRVGTQDSTTPKASNVWKNVNENFGEYNTESFNGEHEFKSTDEWKAIEGEYSRRYPVLSTGAAEESFGNGNAERRATVKHSNVHAADERATKRPKSFHDGLVMFRRDSSGSDSTPANRPDISDPFLSEDLEDEEDDEGSLDDGPLEFKEEQDVDLKKASVPTAPRRVQAVGPGGPKGKNIAALASALGQPLPGPAPTFPDTDPIDTPSTTKRLPPRIVSASSTNTNNNPTTSDDRSTAWSDDDDDDPYKPLSIDMAPFMPLPTMFPYQDFSGFSDYGGHTSGSGTPGHSRSRIGSASTFATMSTFPWGDGDDNASLTLFDHLADDLKAASATATVNRAAERGSVETMSIVTGQNVTSAASSVMGRMTDTS